MKRILLFCICLVMLLSGCKAKTHIQKIDQLVGPHYVVPTQEASAEPTPTPAGEGTEGMTILERFSVPAGYIRASGKGFGAFLQTLPLLKDGDAPKQYDGAAGSLDKAAAVINLPVSSLSYENAGDSLIRLMATYLYSLGLYDKIVFTIGNGFKFSFDSWRQGQLLKQENEQFSWMDGGDISDGEENFRKYLDTLFTYATVRTLKGDLKAKAADAEVEIGDILMDENASSCAIVVDLAVDAEGNIIYILASGSSTAQQMAVLKNPSQQDLSPWYLNAATVSTPNMVFPTAQRYVFAMTTEEVTQP